MLLSLLMISPVKAQVELLVEPRSPVLIETPQANSFEAAIKVKNEASYPLSLGVLVLSTADKRSTQIFALDSQEVAPQRDLVVRVSMKGLAPQPTRRYQIRATLLAWLRTPDGQVSSPVQATFETR